jgi:hypothetical protein
MRLGLMSVDSILLLPLDALIYPLPGCKSGSLENLFFLDKRRSHAIASSSLHVLASKSVKPYTSTQYPFLLFEFSVPVEDRLISSGSLAKSSQGCESGYHDLRFCGVFQNFAVSICGLWKDIAIVIETVIETVIECRAGRAKPTSWCVRSKLGTSLSD